MFVLAFCTLVILVQEIVTVCFGFIVVIGFFGFSFNLCKSSVVQFSA